MGRGRVGRFGWHGVEQNMIEGIPTYFGPMLHVPVVSYLVTMAWLAWFALKNSDHKRPQAHLFYNQLTLYLPALMLLHMRGHKTYVDIEDAPIADLSQKKGRFLPKFGANAPPRIFSSYVSGGALLASSALAAGTRVRPTLAYYGAVDIKNERSEKAGYPLHILVSGTLEPATGMTLLAQSLELIDLHNLSKSITVHITGQGSSVFELQEVTKRLKNVKVMVLGRVGAEDYRKTLEQADIGLSLKLVGGPYADSTFPSKAIEYAENGLMIISTDISDVRTIFGNSARYLTTNSPAALAETIIAAAQNPRETRMLGRQAQRIITDRLSYPRAGEMLKDFFFGAAW
jgi:glycosyltransferase involved in cell wall biosynthesis